MKKWNPSTQVEFGDSPRWVRRWREALGNASRMLDQVWDRSSDQSGFAKAGAFLRHAELPMGGSCGGTTPAH